MSSGTRVADADINTFVKGKTTEAEVVAKLGQPQSVSRHSNGERTDSYVYTKVATRAESFIPLIGGFIGGVDSKYQMVNFTFTKDGVLRDWSASTSDSAMNTGLLSQ